MGNKNKTNPQISEFEFITIKKKKKCLYQNFVELFKKIHTLKKNKITFHIISFQRIGPLSFVLSTCAVYSVSDLVNIRKYQNESEFLVKL